VISIGTVLVIFLILILIGAFPRWQHSKDWGLYPSGIAGVILIIILIMLIVDR
jgi:hypothetical protein